MLRAVNTTMERKDLFTPQGRATCAALDALASRLAAGGQSASSWLGTLPGENEDHLRAGGMAQRLDYQPLPGAVDDLRFPWFLYWEAHWVLMHTRPFLRPDSVVLDAGGASSLFSCHLADQGFEVHSVDLNPRLAENQRRLADAMGWRVDSYPMDLGALDFADETFDCAFSICVFEHLDLDVKHRAIAEIARVLKPGGVFAMTFDYRNPAPGVAGVGKDPRPRNRLDTPQDLRRSFMVSDVLRPVDGGAFQDTGSSYLVSHVDPSRPYTFGAMFFIKADPGASQGGSNV